MRRRKKEEDHGERSCFYSLSFLAEAKDVVYLLGQTASYCILLCVYIITTLLLPV